MISTVTTGCFDPKPLCGCVVLLYVQPVIQGRIERIGRHGEIVEAEPVCIFRERLFANSVEIGHLL